MRNIYSGALDLSGPTPVAVAALLLVGAAAIAWRRAKGAFRLDVVVGLAIVAGFVSVSRIVGEIFPYLVIWTWALGMLTWLAISWSVVWWWRTAPGSRSPGRPDRARRGGRRARRRLGGEHRRRGRVPGNPDVPGSRWVRGLTAKVRDALPAGDGVVEIRSSGGAGSTWIGAGIADELEHHGIDTRVPPDLAFAYGPDRVLDGEQRASRRAPRRRCRARGHAPAPVLPRRRAGRQVHAVRPPCRVPRGQLTRAAGTVAG